MRPVSTNARLVGLGCAWAVLCLAGAAAGPAAAAPAESEASAVDPRLYLRLSWNDHEIVEPCETGWRDTSGRVRPAGKPRQTGDELVFTEPCRQSWEVIGVRDELVIDFARDRIKQNWGFQTRGELTLRGVVTPAGDNPERHFEIPGYAVIGEKTQPPPLDLSRASKLYSQLQQGALFAQRFATAAKQAELAALEAQTVALAQLIAAQENLLRVTEIALRRVYNAAFDFRLSAKHLKDAAQEIRDAEAALGALRSPEQAAREARLGKFFSEMEIQRPEVMAWLDSLLDAGNEAYLPLLGEVVGRDADVIRAAAEDIKAKYAAASIGNQKALAAAMAQILDKARLLTLMQEAIYLKYKQLSPEVLAEMQATYQYRQLAPAGFRPEDLEVPRVLLTSAACLPGCCQVSADRCASPVTEAQCMGLGGVSFHLGGTCRTDSGRCGVLQPPRPDAADVETEALRRAQERLEAIATMLRELTGPGQRIPARVSRKALDSFTDQIRTALQKIEDLKQQKAELAGPIARLRQELELGRLAIDNCMETLLQQKTGLEALIMLDFYRKLIDEIRPVTLSVARLDLDKGDRVSIQVSLTPDFTGQATFDFVAAPWGWRAPLPRVKDVITFVDSPDPGSSFAPRPAVSALWNFYGKSPKLKSKWRTIAPGFGITAAFLDFNNDQAIEVGLGLTVSVFDDLIHFTYGYNLQEEFELEVAPGELVGRGREFFGLGVSLSKVVQQVTPE